MRAPRDCLIAQVLSEGTSIPYIETSITTRQLEVKEIAASYSYVPAATDVGPFVLVIGRDISRLREVERLKSDFVSVVSHELRTPLAVIKGYAATLLNPRVVLDRDRELRFVKGINDAADRLTRLIDNVLSVSRFESGRFRLNLQQCDLRETQSAESRARSSTRRIAIRGASRWRTRHFPFVWTATRSTSSDEPGQ